MRFDFIAMDFILRPDHRKRLERGLGPEERGGRILTVAHKKKQNVFESHQ
jgi:hypothetical protein